MSLKGESTLLTIQSIRGVNEGEVYSRFHVFIILILGAFCSTFNAIRSVSDRCQMQAVRLKVASYPEEAMRSCQVLIRVRPLVSG